ncbi:hypothetical protein HYH03_012921 [Edaphochlamys debaryana]|uniref:Uncharacterized protein n=1 Tax=Edaphochlamys debaryana TaxID=47281 RepID=A0A835XS23_9CHLO|nr:hypothetical protein HYH03_012921 [Edaphochlamys debaryana]|eukprot:KAG2488602.1 hypothetical protein HYH03_012921 [Edaphochlamys debaryana]
MRNNDDEAEAATTNAPDGTERVEPKLGAAETEVTHPSSSWGGADGSDEGGDGGGETGERHQQESRPQEPGEGAAFEHFKVRETEEDYDYDYIDSRAAVTRLLSAGRRDSGGQEEATTTARDPLAEGGDRDRRELAQRQERWYYWTNDWDYQENVEIMWHYRNPMLAELGRTLGSGLAGSVGLRRVLSLLPAVGDVLRGLPDVLSWWGKRWDEAMTPLLRTALCSAAGTPLPDAQATAALAFLRHLGVPLLSRFFATNTGVIMADKIANRTGFSVSNLTASLITRSNLGAAVAAAQAVADPDAWLAWLAGADWQDDYDHYSYWERHQRGPGLHLLVLYAVLRDPRFRPQDAVIDSLVLLLELGEMPLAGPTATTSPAGSRCRLWAASDDPTVQALFAMTEPEREALKAFRYSFTQLHAALASMLTAMGVRQSAPLPGTEEWPVYPAPAPQAPPDTGDGGGLSKGAEIGIIVGCTLGGLLLVAGVVAAVVVVRRGRGQGAGGGGGARVRPEP